MTDMGLKIVLKIVERTVRKSYRKTTKNVKIKDFLFVRLSYNLKKLQIKKKVCFIFYN